MFQKIKPDFFTGFFDNLFHNSARDFFPRNVGKDPGSWKVPTGFFGVLRRRVNMNGMSGYRNFLEK